MPAEFTVEVLTVDELEPTVTSHFRAPRMFSYERSIVTADPGLEGSVWGALQVLERYGLIWDRGEQLVPQSHGMQHEYEISPYGDYLIDRLAASN